jgi:hypothetical protein
VRVDVALNNDALSLVAMHANVADAALIIGACEI